MNKKLKLLILEPYQFSKKAIKILKKNFQVDLAPKKISNLCEMFFVIGSRNSSNSVRLVEVAKNSGCSNALLIHSESDIPFEKISKCSTIGISSGASAPEILVKNFINSLKEKFKLNIKEVEIVKENVTFKIPGKLN